MKDRREPTISPLSADANDAPNSVRSKPGARPLAPPPPPVSARPIIKKSPFGFIALLIAVFAVGFAGFVYWQQLQIQHDFSISSSRLDTANQRIAELEKKLTMADDESSQSLTAISAQVKENVAEIRKLWGVSYDTNRKAIADLTGQYNKLSASLGNLEKSTNQTLQDVGTELKVLGDLTEAQQSVIGRSDQWMNQQKQSLDALTQNLNELENKLSDRIAGNERAIEAIDAFRVQVNRELLKLQGG